jgi:putative two-component system response regulator
MITADNSADVKRRALSLGAKDFISKPFDSAEVLLRIRNHLETRFLHQKLRDQNIELEAKVAERTQELEQSQLEVLERLAAAVEFRDDDTGNHTRRVGDVSAMLGQAIGLESTTVALIRRAAPPRHRKIGIPDSGPLKPSPHWRRVRDHEDAHRDRITDAIEGKIRAGALLPAYRPQPP